MSPKLMEEDYECLSHLAYSISDKACDEEPKPKSRPLPGYSQSRKHRSVSPPLRDELPQLLPAEEFLEVFFSEYNTIYYTDPKNIILIMKVLLPGEKYV